MKSIVGITSVLAALATSSSAATFIPISSASSSTAGTDLWPASNLIQGPGAGYDAAEPHAQLGGGSTHRWVTGAPGGFPSDFIEVAGAPVITLDLGSDAFLGEVSVWGYAATNANGASEFSLRFATDADGAAGFGSTISYNPLFGGAPNSGSEIPNNDVDRMSFLFSENVTARYVEMTISDHWFVAPGDGTGGETPGGDRVGLGEIAFEANVVIPESSSSLLGLLGLGMIALHRRRR